MQAGGPSHPLRDFASFFLSTSQIGCDHPAALPSIASLLSASVSRDNVFCSIPSFSLRNVEHHSGSPSKEILEQDAASSLSQPIEVLPGQLHNLPSIVARNIAESFMCLVDSRVRSTVHALWSHVDNDPTERMSQILQMFFAVPGSLVEPTSIDNVFQIGGIPFSKTVGGKTTSLLKMETAIVVNILDKKHTLVLQGSGTISGVLDSPSNMLTAVSVTINGADFLKAMMTRARDAVRLATDRIMDLFVLSSEGLGGGGMHLTNEHGLSVFAQINGTQPADRLSANSECVGAWNDEKTGEASSRKSELQGVDTRSAVSHQHQRQGHSEFKSGKESGLWEGGMKLKCFSGVDLLRLAAESLG
eukprot:scaffold1120_cov127-Cylindrotheca_fusiformis.AAC.11